MIHSGGLPAEQPDGSSTARPRAWAVLWSLSRPRLLLWMLGIVLFGYGFAHWDQLLVVAHPAALGWLLVAWSFGNAGTMWLNAALDREEGAALFAAQVRVPWYTGWAGYASLALSIGVALLARPLTAVLVASCSALAVVYSHPKTAWKGHPVLGPVVNALGYGLLSPLAGWSLTGAALTWRVVLTFCTWTVWILGAYFAAQAFQREDDARRGYRTLVVTHGPAVALRVARWCMNGAILVTFALTIAGVYPRVTLFAYPLLFWADRAMVAWQRQPRGGGPEWAARVYGRMLIGGLVIIATAYLDYWFLLDPITHLLG